MGTGALFKMETSRSMKAFIEQLRKNASRFGFSIRHVLNMKEEYKKNDVEVDDHFELYQIVLCNFARSYKSMKKDINRAAVLLQPKQVIVYKDNGATSVTYLPFSREFIRKSLPEDEQFSESLHESCQRIVQLIKSSG